MMNKNFICASLCASTLLAWTSVSVAQEAEDDEKNVYNPWYLMVDRTQEGWEIGASLVYLQSELSSDLSQYAIFDVEETESGYGEGGSNGNISDHYHTGFDVFVRYLFENGQDLTARYTYFHEKNTGDGTCGFNSTTDYQNCTSYPSGEHFHGDASASVSNNFNEAELLFGQRFILGEQMDLRLFGGVSAAWINIGVDQYFTEIRGHGVDNGSYIDFNFNSEFEGIGPMVGFDGAYQIASSPIYLYLGASVAGLVGQSTANATEYQYIPADDEINTIVWDGGEEDAFVTNLNVDLGLRYEYEWSDEYAAAILLGYRVNEYIDAVRQTTEYGAANGDYDDPNYVFTQVDSTSNYSMNGPYLTLSAMF